MVEFIGFGVIAFGAIAAFSVALELHLCRTVELGHMAAALARAEALGSYQKVLEWVPRDFEVARHLSPETVEITVTKGDASSSARQVR